MYQLKQNTAITVPVFAHDENGDPVTGLVNSDFTKRISKNGGAFAAMTVTITEMENGWYSLPLTTSHTDTLGYLSVTLIPAGAEQINLLWTISARLFDDLATQVSVNTVDTVVDAIQVKTDQLLFSGGDVIATLNGETVTVGTNNDKTGYALTALESMVQHSGTAQAGGASTITLAGGASAVDDFYVGAVVKIYGGVGANQRRVVTDYNGTTKVATVSRAWQTNPDNTSTYAVLAVDLPALDVGLQVVSASVQGNVTGSVASVVGAVGSVAGAVGSVTGNVGGNVTGSVGSVAAGGITAASIATGAVDADALAADAVAEIADGVWDEALSGHAISGSTGAALSGAGSAGDPWTTSLPGIYGAGTAGNIVGALVSSDVSDVPEEVWNYANRTLTLLNTLQSGDVATGDVLVLYQTTTFEAEITGVDLTDWDKLWFTVKTSVELPDRNSLIQISNPDGLLYINKQVADTPGDGSIDVGSTSVTINLDEAATGLVPTATNALWDLKKLTTGGTVSVIASGQMNIKPVVTLAFE